jgi:hypothetical protein
LRKNSLSHFKVSTAILLKLDISQKKSEKPDSSLLFQKKGTVDDFDGAKPISVTLLFI